eukprot:2927263-Rhodomonas_salina.1
MVEQSCTVRATSERAFRAKLEAVHLKGGGRGAETERRRRRIEWMHRAHADDGACEDAHSAHANDRGAHVEANSQAHAQTARADSTCRQHAKAARTHPAQHAIRLPPAASEHTPLLRHTLAALATARAILFPQRAHPSAAVFFHAMRVALAQPSLSSLLDAEPWLRIWASFLWRPALVAGDARARLADRIRRAWGSEEAFAALA